MHWQTPTINHKAQEDYQLVVQHTQKVLVPTAERIPDEIMSLQDTSCTSYYINFTFLSTVKSIVISATNEL